MKLPESDDRSPYQREAWSHIRALLPPDLELERWAREMGALRRRRGVKAATALLRVLLSYACSPLSFQEVSEWAQDSAWAKLNKNAARGRLLRAAPWLKHLLDWVLDQRTTLHKVAGRRVVLVDGTRFSPPGTKGTGWCGHVLVDPWSAQTLQLQLTDRRGGEHLRRFRFTAEDLVIADCGYAHRRGLAHVVNQDGQFLVRTNWCNLPFETLHGREFDLFKAAEHLKEKESTEVDVRIMADRTHGLPALPVRLLVYRKTDEAAEAARKKATAEARRTKRQVNERTLEACQYVLLVTNVRREQLSAAELLELYRLRWQIELGFKRWKSLLRVNDLHVRHPESVRATLTAKLLGAVLVESFVARQGTAEGLWQRTGKISEAFRQALLGERALVALLETPTRLHEPKPDRKRPRQREALLRFLPATPGIQSLQPTAA